MIEFPRDDPTTPPDEHELAHLRALSRQFPTIDSAVAEIAALRAQLTLPKGTVHVFSDVHGEDKKLRHVLANASGNLRPLVDQLFADKASEEERRQLLALIYYPGETLEYLTPQLADPDRRARFVERMMELELDVLRALARDYPLTHVRSLFPPAYRDLFLELLVAPQLGRNADFTWAIRQALSVLEKDLESLRLLARVIRNLAVSEIVVAGDLGDRGPRVDKVVELLMRQPHVAITWGNHDVSWMGACLGHESLIATVLRVSLRYDRVAQLVEGYGISLGPLEELARKRYGEDPAERFRPKGQNLEDPLLMARMQKAAAVLEFKLEGQLAARNPHYGVEHRRVLHLIDHQSGTIALGGQRYELLDKYFPTIHPSDPYALDDDERRCMTRLKQAFMHSRVLWDQMSYVFRKGAMHLIRDGALILHGCVPVDAQGQFQALEIEGRQVAGRALFEACRQVVQRAWREGRESDKDFLWYLWAGALSPLFGKDKMATFERYFIADKATHKENKNAFFKLMHDAAFCERVLEEFGVDKVRGLMVTGHVVVKEGESPVKHGGRAITIDGAFAEAYGDRGYTLMLTPDRTALALHHHFESVAEAVSSGTDIIPTVSDVRVFDQARLVANTDQGDQLRRDITALEKLVVAYRENFLQESK